MHEQLPKRGGTKQRWLPQDSLDASSKSPVRLPKRKRFDAAQLALPCFALATGAMVGLSAPQLIDTGGFSGWLKIALLSSSAALVSYVVNKYAVEQGAGLASRGYLSAGIVSVLSIVIVGGGLFASTYAGLTLSRVNDLKLGRHGEALPIYVGAVHHYSARSLQVRPALDAAVADIDLHLSCERQESCLSGRASGGRGSVTRALEPVASRAREISGQVLRAQTQRQERLARINRLIGTYQSTFSGAELSISERRRALSQIDSEIKQAAAALIEVAPLALLTAYSKELSSGLSLPGRPEAERNINALLGRHGLSVQAALESIPESPPAFPQSAGVSATFAYIGHFLPIAALTAVIGMIMPLTLWVYMLLTHLWHNYKEEPTDLSASSASQASGGTLDV